MSSITLRTRGEKLVRKVPASDIIALYRQGMTVRAISQQLGCESNRNRKRLTEILRESHCAIRRGGGRQLGMGEVAGCKIAVIQALRFVFKRRVTEIARLLDWEPSDVSRVTVMESWKGVPWEMRRFQDVAVEKARQLICELCDKSNQECSNQE